MKRTAIIQATALFLLLGIAFPAGARQGKPEKQEEKAKPAKPEQPAKPERQNQDNPVKTDQRQQAKGQQEQEKQPRDDSRKQQQQQANRQQDEQRQQQQDQSNKHEQRIAKGQQDQQRQQQQQRQDNSAQQQEQARAQQDQDRVVRQQPYDKSAQQRSPAQTHQQQVAWQGDRAHNWQSQHRTWQQRGGYTGYRVPDDRFRSYYGQDHGFRIYALPVRYVGGHRRFQYGGYWFGLIDPWPEYWSNDWYDSDDVYVDYYDDGYYLYNRRYPSDRISISFYLN